MLAIGSFVGASGSGREDIQLYQAARSHLTAAILEKGSLPLVQSLTLMGNYLQKRNKPNAGFNILGVAVNMALAIGLHREFHPSRTTPFVMELRRRTWWTLFVFESGARLTLGRPPVTLTGVTVGLPTNMHDYELAVDIDLLPPPQNVPTVTSYLQAQVSLARIANAAHVKLHSSCSLRPCEVLQFDTEVRNWLASLPPYFGSEHEWASSPKMILLWRAAHLRIIICRPFLFAAIRARAPLDIQAPDGRYMPSPLSICVSIAHECALSICDYWAAKPLAERNRGLAWYASYWLTTAGVVLATCLIYDATHLLADQWRTELSRTLATLAELGKACDMASKACEILGGYVGKWNGIVVCEAMPLTADCCRRPPASVLDGRSTEPDESGADTGDDRRPDPATRACDGAGIRRLWARLFCRLWRRRHVNSVTNQKRKRKKIKCHV